MSRCEENLIDRLCRLPLRRCGTEERAGLLLASVPLPRSTPPDLTLGGRPTSRQLLGRWPGAERNAARRMILAADGGGFAPAELTVEAGRVRPENPPPSAELRLAAESPDFYVAWESHALRIAWAGRWLDLILGLRRKREIHWWQAARLVVREETESCRIIEVGGAIPAEWMTRDDFLAQPGLDNRFLHRHNWLNGHLFGRLHANGVCEFFAHHINSRFFDDGLPLQDAVPVIGLRLADMAAADTACGPLTGCRTGLQLGDISVDFTDAAPLATPDKPGAVWRQGEFLIWQPYRGVELHAGDPAHVRAGDPFICRAEDEVIPRGMARTVRFSVSLSPDRPARVQRYLAPAWWYGLCEEFRPAPLLPVSNAYDGDLRTAAQWRDRWSVQSGFEDGSVARGFAAPKPEGRFEPGWEGEAPYAHMLYAWRTGDAREYELALRSCYFFTDVCVDHAAQMVRMHGWPPNAFAVPMNRVHACVAAWLETGDPYPLNTARAVIDTSYWTHKNSWPRMAVGRDAAFTRGAVLLYRYLNLESYRELARDALADTAESQLPDGSFGDQGGGTGLHQWGAYIIKPWMGLMAVNGMLDYLELFPDDAPLAESVRRFGEWLLRERRGEPGARGWSYQHAFRGGTDFIDAASGKAGPLNRSPGWHLEYLARFLMFCSVRFDRSDFFEAWEESHRAFGPNSNSDHGFAQVMQFIPWLQSSLWPVRQEESGLVARPLWLGPKTPRWASVDAPGVGPIRLTWSDDGVAHADKPDALKIEPTSVHRPNR